MTAASLADFDIGSDDELLALSDDTLRELYVNMATQACEQKMAQGRCETKVLVTRFVEGASPPMPTVRISPESIAKALSERDSTVAFEQLISGLLHLQSPLAQPILDNLGGAPNLVVQVQEVQVAVLGPNLGLNMQDIMKKTTLEGLETTAMHEGVLVRLRTRDRIAFGVCPMQRNEHGKISCQVTPLLIQPIGPRIAQEASTPPEAVLH